MSQDFVAAYGSLMSKFSRENFSKIYEPVLPVIVLNWRRYWCVNDHDEGATHCGAIFERNAQLEAVLVPTIINDELRQRERNYSPLLIDQSSILGASSLQPIHSDLESRYWIFSPKAPNKPTNACPIVQTYVDTCLVGCFEAGGPRFADSFVACSRGWSEPWINDRNRPVFPRAAPAEGQIAQIDALLESHNVIKFRKEPPT
jgi:hypothetical protein